MTTPGGISTGLAFLPTWLSEAREGHTLETNIAAWADASGWQHAGLIWPVDGLAVVTVSSSATPPTELVDVLKSLLAGRATVVWQLPGSSGRLYALLSPSGRSPGVVWAERSSSEPWTDIDRNYLTLSAKLIERSPLLAGKIGVILDSERLQQRLSDASAIAGRMAHDFDNILTGIIGFSDLTMPLLTPGSQPAKFVNEISKVGHRGIVFTQQLHQFSRSGQTKPQPGNVVDAVAKEEIRQRPSMTASIQFAVQFPTNLPAVAMEAGPLQALVGHLIENAVESSVGAHAVTVSGRPVELNATDARTFLGQVSAGSYVEITVRDSGGGMKPEVLAKLFVEPFVTTKVRHRGLGLAIVYRTLIAHRGGIRIDAATPTPGTIARVVIPIAAARSVIVPAATLASNTLQKVQP